MNRADCRRTWSSLVLAGAVAALCAHPATLLAQPDPDVQALREDLKGRRARLMAKLGDNTIAILWSAPARVYSRDIDYEYRQDSDMLYLTGVEQADTILVLVPGSRRRKEFLFVSPSNPRREHYVGVISAPARRARAPASTRSSRPMSSSRSWRRCSAAGRTACRWTRRATTTITTVSSAPSMPGRRVWRCVSSRRRE